jgi:membrane protease YdiL (CAAX protease family)
VLTEEKTSSAWIYSFFYRKNETLNLPLWKIALYSLGILAMPIVGEQLGEAFPFIHVLEIIETIPTLLCMIFVMRLPPPIGIQLPRWLRIALPILMLPLLLLVIGSPSGGLGSGAFTLALLNALAIGVTEEFTFRWSLHRLWGHYGSGFYVIASSLVFGLMHYPLGVQAVIITAIIGTVFGLIRIAGMPVTVLVVLHGLMDLPQMVNRFSSLQ